MESDTIMHNCKHENKIEIPIWDQFVIDNRYVLIRIGTVIKCSNCQGMLEEIGETKHYRIESMNNTSIVFNYV